MAKKIYDIKPPRLASKTAASPEKRANFAPKVREKEESVKSSHAAPRKKEKKSIWLPIFTLVLVVFVLVGVYLFFKLPKASIAIWPKVNTLSFQQTIVADKSASLVDVTNKVIPAQYFQAIKTTSQNFPATGNAANEGMATGTITVYNKYSPQTPFTFKAGTHFMSDSGKLFVSLQKVVIPAAKKSGSSVVPGSVKIQIQAVESGPDYNIAPANFSIPGLKGTPSYYSIYAVSSSAMAGGYTGKVKKVTDDDIQGAKDVLTKGTTADAISALKGQISSDYILLDNAVLSNVTDSSTKTKSGAIADSFDYSVTVSASALAFKKSDIDQFVKNYVISQAPVGTTLLDGSSKVDYSASTVDVSGGKATVNLNFSYGVYQNIDKNSVALSMLGEDSNQVRTTVEKSLGSEVSKVTINFWPFWVSSVPNNQNAVSVELKFQ